MNRLAQRTTRIDASGAIYEEFGEQVEGGADLVKKIDVP